MKEKLFALQDLEYRDFCSSLMPTVEKRTVIGVRTPCLRNLAREVRGSAEAEAFLQTLPHAYYEENNLHGCLISLGKDYETVLGQVEEFLPYVDNWATCDMLSPPVLRKNLEKLFPVLKRWLASGHTYTVRFAVKTLMSWYLDAEFSPEVLALAAQACCEEYYINMAVAWLFATALAKQYDAAVVYLEEGRLPKWVHNKTIQKAIESYRVSGEKKEYLRTLKKGASA